MWHVLINVILPIYILIALGFLSGKLKKDIETDTITFIVLYFFAPTLILSSFKNINLSIENVKFIVINGALTIGIVWIAAGIISKKLYGKRIPALEISSAVMNIGYLGLPLIYVLFGEKALGYAITYMVFVTIIHFTVAIVALNPESFKKGLSETFKIPLIYAVIAAFLLKKFHFPEGIEKMLKLTGDSTMPLMLIAIGIKLSRIKPDKLSPAITGTILRLVLGTFISFAVVKTIQAPLLLKQTVFIQSTLPSAILNFVLCDRFNQNPEISASIIFLSTLISPLWLIFVIKVLLPAI
ncbi:AEC family transporter [Desulfurobacterium sp.]